MDYTDEQVARVYTEARRARAMLPGHPEIAFDWVQLPADAREQLMRSVSTFRERQHSNVFGHDPLFGAIVRALTPKMTGPGCKIGTFYVDIVPRADVSDTRSYGEEAAQVILDALSPDDGKTAFKPAASNMVDTCGYRLIEVRCPACERCVAVHSGDFTGLDFTPKSLDRAVAAKAERNCPGPAGEHGPVCIGTFPHEHPAEARPETREATDRVADDAEPLSAGSATAPAGAGYVHAAPQKIATVYVDVAPELGHFRYDLAAGLRDIADDIDRPRAGHRADVAENVMSADEARARYGRPARPLPASDRPRRPRRVRHPGVRRLSEPDIHLVRPRNLHRRSPHCAARRAASAGHLCRPDVRGWHLALGGIVSAPEPAALGDGAA